MAWRNFSTISDFKTLSDFVEHAVLMGCMKQCHTFFLEYAFNSSGIIVFVRLPTKISGPTFVVESCGDSLQIITYNCVVIRYWRRILV